MQILSKEEVERKKDILFGKIKDGAVFIYPTDTIYGIGCSALDEKAVQKVRRIKQRPDKPFSIIAPSKNWISDNCDAKKAGNWLKRLPGPYTLILKLKNKNAVAKSVNQGIGTIGVRIPDHWISSFVQELGVPIITPSANVSGREVMTTVDDLDAQLRAHTDFLFDEGERKGSPSKIIDLTGKKEVVLR
jgi:tRNA threonylcarbamoyl adenosine modification protein (Sua5/YciO/YrdC/YwlC family)